MKNISLLFNAVLAVAVAVLFYLHFKGNGAGSGATSAGGKEIVYVNADSLLTNYDFFKDAKKAFEQKRLQLDTELNTKGSTIQREIQVFQQQAGGMIAAEAQAKQIDLQRRAAAFEQYRQKSANDLSMEEAKQNEKLYDNIFAYIKKNNGTNKYQYVLGYQKGGGILFANSDNEVTKQILDGLNKEYKATAKPAEEPKKEEPKK